MFLSVTLGRAAGKLSHTSAVAPHPKHVHSLQRRKMEPSAVDLQSWCRSVLTEKNPHTIGSLLQPAAGEGVRKTDGSSPIQEGAAGRCDR